VADKGEIRVGFRYQAEIPSLKYTPNGTLIEEPECSTQTQANLSQPHNDRVLRSQLQKLTNSQKDSQKEQIPEIPISAQIDELIQWVPLANNYKNYINNLTDREIEQFLIIAKSVGTYARALDCNSNFKFPSLPQSAACASRDITLFHAMTTLHEHNYDIGKATLSLITSVGPVLCKDELEDWSSAEANLFEDALDKIGKDFAEIRREYVSLNLIFLILNFFFN
jgi:hypothetical protein